MTYDCPSPGEPDVLGIHRERTRAEHKAFCNRVPWMADNTGPVAASNLSSRNSRFSVVPHLSPAPVPSCVFSYREALQKETKANGSVSSCDAQASSVEMDSGPFLPVSFS